MKMTWLILVIFELMLSFSANCSAEALKAERQPAQVYQVAENDEEPDGFWNESGDGLDLDANGYPKLSVMFRENRAG